jgi:hypothetical protein
VDVYGEHALTCNHRAVALRRHNAVCGAVRRVAERAGLLPSISNRSVIDRGYLRPADVHLARYPGKASGLAVDVTVVSRWSQNVEKAEEEKRTKYATYLAGCPSLGFCPFALDLNGGVGPAAWAEMVNWAHIIARQPTKMVSYGVVLGEVVAEVAWTLVDEVTRQIRSAADPRFARSAC